MASVSSRPQCVKTQCIDYIIFFIPQIGEAESEWLPGPHWWCHPHCHHQTWTLVSGHWEKIQSNLSVTGLFFFKVQCTPDILQSCISQNWIYCGRMLDPIFLRPRARYFSLSRGYSLDPIRGRHFFEKSAHCDNLCSRFAGDNFSRNHLKPTCQCGLEHMLCDGQPR